MAALDTTKTTCKADNLQKLTLELTTHATDFRILKDREVQTSGSAAAP
jgi:hypothetical protein